MRICNTTTVCFNAIKQCRMYFYSAVTHEKVNKKFREESNPPPQARE